MFEILDASTETCIGVKVSGKVSGQNYEGFIARLDQAIEAHDTINMLLFVHDFQGPADLDAAKADFKFGVGVRREQRHLGRARAPGSYLLQHNAGRQLNSSIEV